eukprot:scaffold16773_cov31-Phaeocystis_antarctica.AAC.2
MRCSELRAAQVGVGDVVLVQLDRTPPEERGSLEVAVRQVIPAVRQVLRAMAPVRVTFDGRVQAGGAAARWRGCVEQRVLAVHKRQLFGEECANAV